MAILAIEIFRGINPVKLFLAAAKPIEMKLVILILNCQAPKSGATYFLGLAAGDLGGWLGTVEETAPPPAPIFTGIIFYSLVPNC